MYLMREVKVMKRLSLLSLALLLSCSPSANASDSGENAQESTSFLDYSEVTTQIKWVDIFEQEEERYLIYFYSEYCGYCRDIKEEFLTYYFGADEKIYFVDSIKEKAVYKSGAEWIIGVNNIDDFFIPGTPFLVEISNWNVTNYYIGVSAIRLYIQNE